MKIDPTLTQKSSMAVQSVKKRHKEDNEAKQEKHRKKTPSHTESIELSETAQLLNNLLHATSNQFSPYPFYFVNAAARNIKQACSIAKKIQNQAESMGVSLNYTMIYEMVVDLANQHHQVQLKPEMNTEHTALNMQEKTLFEKLHNTCLQNQTPTSIIASAAQKYLQFKQTKTTTPPSKQECAKLIIDSLKEEALLNHNETKKSLSLVIKEYVNQTEQTEVVQY